VLCLAVSEMVGREFLHYYARSQRVRVVYNGVEVPRVSDAQREQWRMEFRNRLGVEVTAPVFLTAAMNFKLKGVAEAIGGFARWYHSPEGVAGARLVAVGQEETGSYRLKARARGVAKQVHFVAPTGNVFPWYAAADACILLSWYDPCSRVVLEATRWGIPSITTAYNGAGEILAGGAGIVVSSPRDTKAVAAALAALADSQRRAECAEACRKIADRLTMDRHVEQLLEAYAEAVEP
jgi:UDP-glucose:(heptosyl)LPS alpha-1,3-glucosyltransferase